jgi:hypothetical protein
MASRHGGRTEFSAASEGPIQGQNNTKAKVLLGKKEKEPVTGE